MKAVVGGNVVGRQGSESDLDDNTPVGVSNHLLIHHQWWSFGNFSYKNEASSDSYIYDWFN